MFSLSKIFAQILLNGGSLPKNLRTAAISSARLFFPRSGIQFEIALTSLRRERRSSFSSLTDAVCSGL